jgi:diguanylate cyclase (GGDEF)-like protein
MNMSDSPEALDTLRDPVATRALLRLLARSLGLDRAALFSTADGTCRLAAAEGAFPDGPACGDAVTDLGAASAALSQGRPLLLDSDGRFAVRAPGCRNALQVEGAAVVPVEGGFLWVDRAHGALGERGIEALAAFADLHAELRIGTIKCRDLDVRSRHLSEALEGIRSVLSCRTESEVIAALTEAACLLTGAKTVAACLVMSDGYSCTLVSGIGTAVRGLVGRTFDPARGLVGLALRSGIAVPTGLRWQPAMVEALGDDARLDLSTGDPILVHPIAVGDSRVGAVLLANGDFERDGVVASVRDVCDAAGLLIHQFRLRERIARDSMFDGLTGLYNRVAFLAHLGEAISYCRRHAAPLTLLMLDADHFKKVNDTHGHPVGDAVLRYISDTVRASLRGSDFAGRLGGEEFAIALPHTPLGGARVVAERIRTQCAASPVPIGSLRIPVTLSIGVAPLLPGMKSQADIITAADEALYAAKRGGRNQVVVKGGGE